MLRLPTLFLSFCLLLSCCSTEKEPEVRSGKIERGLTLTQPPPLLKVAFIGDSGEDKDFYKVLKLIKQEKADLVLHLGDLAYNVDKGAPARWDKAITQVLGEDFPYFFTVGNHDIYNWYQSDEPSYSDFLRKRLLANKNISCSGIDGVKSYCSYKGLFMVLSGIGTIDAGHEEFIEESLLKAKSYPWRICAWHKNQREMQAGRKTDEVGWRAYQICQSHGAMIATGHEHSYARSRTLTDLGNSKKNHGAIGNPNAVELDKGKTFVFVSGLGGHSLRPFDCRLRRSANWWASVFTYNFSMENGVIKYSDCDEDDKAPRTADKKPQYTFGALFVTFHYTQDARLAKAVFKTVDNVVVDEFTIRSKL